MDHHGLKNKKQYTFVIPRHILSFQLTRLVCPKQLEMFAAMRCASGHSIHSCFFKLCLDVFYFGKVINQTKCTK